MSDNVQEGAKGIAKEGRIGALIRVITTDVRNICPKKKCGKEDAEKSVQFVDTYEYIMSM